MMSHSSALENQLDVDKEHPHQFSNKRKFWYAGVLLVTLLPLIGLPIASGTELPFRESFLIGLGVFVGGVCHVASTVYFYFDRDARSIMNTMKARFYLLPTVVIAISVAALFLGSQLPIADDFVMSIFLMHLIWLYYHYQKQNYGLLAFTAASHGERLPPITLKLILLPPLAGGLATFPDLLADGLQREVPFSQWFPLLDQMAMIIYLVAATAWLHLAWRNLKVFTQPLVLVFSLISFGFFLPGLLIENIEFAFWSYAIAHGLQYLMMVSIVSAQAKWRFLALGIFAVGAIGGGWVLQRLGGNHALFISGILLTWVHFVLDARLWRMRDSAVRVFLRQRFAFIFN
ncbi:MAG: hypothetical protein MI976_05455 [Pseudomonadales bacterium]|nr:hypothetical protein [Pseudomonadales bacterium]